MTSILIEIISRMLIFNSSTHQFMSMAFHQCLMNPMCCLHFHHATCHFLPFEDFVHLENGCWPFFLMGGIFLAFIFTYSTNNHWFKKKILQVIQFYMTPTYIGMYPLKNIVSIQFSWTIPNNIFFQFLNFLWGRWFGNHP